MRLHIHLLWSLFDAKNIPKLPKEEMLTKFKKCSFTKESLKDFQSWEPLVAISLVKVTSAKLGKIGSQLALIKKHIISYIQGCLAQFGMTSWGPDLHKTAYSLYNSACQIIALDTFKPALISHAYVRTWPKLKYAKDTALLIKINDHIVHQ